MIPVTATSKTIDTLINQTAREIFNFIAPPILLVGEWDDYYRNITDGFQWATHSLKLPATLDPDIGIVVVNKRSLFKHLPARVSKNTAILAYDEDEIIPVNERVQTNPNLICYLRKISIRYVRGHMRTLLQLRKILVCVDDNIPYMITDENDKSVLRHVIRQLDFGDACCLITPKPAYFFRVFKESAKLSHYESVEFVESPALFNQAITNRPTTLVLNVRSPKDIAAYQEKSLQQYSIIYVSTRPRKALDGIESIAMPMLGVSEETFYFTCYFHGLRENLRDPLSRTRFLQVKQIKYLIDKHSHIGEFDNELSQIFSTYLIDGKKFKFRNMPFSIETLSFCNYPLTKLLQQFERSVINEVMAQTNNTLGQAQMVSGIHRVNLAQRLSKKDDIDPFSQKE